MADDPNDEERRFSERDDFLHRIGLALSPYQLIEEILKIYIEVAHLKIQQRVGKIPFRYPRHEYENAPLEHLIRMFKRYCDNDDFINRLQRAKNDRNYVAHKAITHYMEHHHDDDSAKMYWELTRIEEQGYDLAEQLQKELAKLKATAE
jgi:hypothetical protein